MRIRLKVRILGAIFICGVITIVAIMAYSRTTRDAVAEKPVSLSFHKPIREPFRRPIVIDGIFGRKRQMGMYDVLLPGWLGNAKTYKASLNGLRWLQAVQNEDGSWGTPSNSLMITGLAALSYLYMENMPDDSSEFGETVRCALEYLVSEQVNVLGKEGQPSQSLDDLSIPIATTALAEFHRKIWNPNVKAVAESGLCFIIRQQDFTHGSYVNNDKMLPNMLVYTGWNSIALEAGLKARILGSSRELRDALDREQARFCSFTNILSPIRPDWHGMTPLVANNGTPHVKRPGIVEKEDDLPPHLLFLATRKALNSGDDCWKRWFDIMWPSIVDAQYVTPSGEAGIKCNCPFCHEGIFGVGLNEPYRRCDGKMIEIGHWIGLDTNADSIIIDTCLAILNLNMANYQFFFNFRIDEVPLPKASTTNDVEVDFGI